MKRKILLFAKGDTVHCQDGHFIARWNRNLFKGQCFNFDQLDYLLDSYRPVKKEGDMSDAYSDLWDGCKAIIKRTKT